MWREPKPSRGLHEHGEVELVRELAGQPARRRRDPELLEEARARGTCRPSRSTTSAAGSSTSAGSSSPRALGEHQVVEVGERDDEPDVVLAATSSRSAGDVAGVVDARHERVAVGVVERGRERVDVGGDRRRAGPSEGGDDVDALPRAGEEDRGHGERG